MFCFFHYLSKINYWRIKSIQISIQITIWINSELFITIQFCVPPAYYVSRIGQRSEATEIHNVASKKDDHAIIMISSKPFMIVICHRTTKNHWWVQVIFAMFLKQNCVKASNTFSRQINFLLYVLLLPFFYYDFLLAWYQ